VGREERGEVKLDAVNRRMDELGRERSGIEWKELKVITLIFTTEEGHADRKNVTARESQVHDAFVRESGVCSTSE